MLGKTGMKGSYLNYIISNSIWINKEIKGNIKEEYKDVLADKYDSVIKKITNKEANVLNEEYNLFLVYLTSKEFLEWKANQ